MAVLPSISATASQTLHLEASRETSKILFFALGRELNNLKAHTLDTDLCVCVALSLFCAVGTVRQ